MTFPSPNSIIHYNDSGEPIGWDSPNDDDPPDIEDYYDPRWDEYDEKEEDDE